MPTLSFSAVLLAAGKSSRMGTDKALLAVNGLLLWRRQWGVLERAGARELFLSVRPGQAWVPADARVVHDAAENAGPIAGIAAALTQCRSSHLIVLAVDLPRMEAEWFDRLTAHCGPGVGVVGKGGSFFEPLAAIYPREMLPLVATALAKKDYSLQRLIAGAGGLLATVEIGRAETVWFDNWNEPATGTGI